MLMPAYGIFHTPHAMLRAQKQQHRKDALREGIKYVTGIQYLQVNQKKKKRKKWNNDVLTLGWS